MYNLQNLNCQGLQPLKFQDLKSGNLWWWKDHFLNGKTSSSL